MTATISHVPASGAGPLASPAVGSSPSPLGFPNLWTAQELAVFLRVSRRKVFSDLSRGAIPCVRLGNHAPRFIPSDILRWLEWGCPSAKEFTERKRKAD